MSNGLCGECFDGYSPDEWQDIVCPHPECYDGSGACGLKDCEICAPD